MNRKEWENIYKIVVFDNYIWIFQLTEGAFHVESTQHLTSPSWFFLKFGAFVNLDEYIKKIKILEFLVNWCRKYGSLNWPNANTSRWLRGCKFGSRKPEGHSTSNQHNNNYYNNSIINIYYVIIYYYYILIIIIITIMIINDNNKYYYATLHTTHLLNTWIILKWIGIDIRHDVQGDIFRQKYITKNKLL